MSDMIPSKNTIFRILVILAVVVLVAVVGYLRYFMPWTADSAILLLFADIGWILMMVCIVSAVISIAGIGISIHQLADNISEYNNQKENIKALRRRVNKLERELKEIKREQCQKRPKQW